MDSSLGERLRSVARIVGGRAGDVGDGERDGDGNENGGGNRNGDGDGEDATGGEAARGGGTTVSGGGDADRERRADRAFRERADGRPDRSPDPDAPRHVVCVVVDALRADAVDPAYAPFLDDVVDVAAISPSTWTFPAVTSLLSGTYPHRHGATRSTDGFEDSVADVTPLPEPTEATLLPDALAEAGYATYGAFGFVVPFLALEGHFATHRLYDDAPAGEILADHADWLASHREQPTFSYLHLADLHEPVDPPDGYLTAHEVDEGIPGVDSWRHEDVVEPTPTVERYRDHRRRLYRAAVEHVDNRLAAHRRRVDDLLGSGSGGDGGRAGGEADVAHVVTADHGEGFWERAELHAGRFADPRPAYCVGHGGPPWEPVVRVPLGVSGLDVAVSPDRRTSLVDVAPTVAQAVGVELGGNAAPGPVDGVALSEPVPDDRRVLVEGARYGYEKKAVYGDGHKLIASRGDDEALALSLPDGEAVDVPDAVEASLRESLPPWPGERGEGSERGEGGEKDEEGDERHERDETDVDVEGDGGDGRSDGDGRSVAPDVEERLERLGYG